MYSSRYSAYPTTPIYTTYNFDDQQHTTPYYAAYSPRPSEKSSKQRRRTTSDAAYVYTTTAGPAYYYPPPEPKSHSSSSHRHRDSGKSSSKRSHKTKSHEKTYIYSDSSGRYYTSDGRPAYAPQEQSRTYEADFGSAHERKYRYSPPPEQPYHRQSQSYPGAYVVREDVYTSHKRTESRGRKERSDAYAPPPSQPPPQPMTGMRAATAADASRAEIPAGFSLKHWDPTEEPILLLGSVFDANSLGKWIYDWTVATHGIKTPLTEMAGDLWLLLIQLAGKIKRAEEKIGRVRDRDDKDLLDDFLDSGERLWSRFSKLLKICESYMLKAAKKHSSSKKYTVGKDSGVQFVKCIFGRDRELERTEKIMTGIRLWSMRFDANCNDILRHA